MSIGPDAYHKNYSIPHEILCMLSGRKEPLPRAEIVEELGIDRAAVSRAMNRMGELGIYLRYSENGECVTLDERCKSDGEKLALLYWARVHESTVAA